MDTVKRRRLLILELLVGTVIVGFILLGARARSAPPAASNAAAQSAFVSLPTGVEWAMEGHNPARTRAINTAIPVPMTRRRDVLVNGDLGSGSPPSISQNTLLVEVEKSLRAIDLQSGAQRWSVSQPGTYISPAIAGNLVYIRSESANKGSLLALDLASGRQVWSFAPKRLSSSETNFYGGHLTSPVVVAGVVFVGAGKEVYALDAATGAVRWEYVTQDYITSSASVDAGRVYISDFEHFYAIDQQTGTLLWVVQSPSSAYFSAIAAGNTVLISNGENLSALDAQSGTQRWIAHYPGQSLIPAAVQGQRVFVKSTETLYALDLASGRELWHYADLNYVSLPAVAGDQIFLVTGSGADAAVEARDVANGRITWKQLVAHLSNNPPIIAGTTVYVRTTRGRVIGFWQ